MLLLYREGKKPGLMRGTFPSHSWSNPSIARWSNRYKTACKKPGLETITEGFCPWHACNWPAFAGPCQVNWNTTRIRLNFAHPRGCPWYIPSVFSDTTEIPSTFENSIWRLKINRAFEKKTRGKPLCCMPAVLLGILPGKFSRGFKPLSKSLAKGHYSCSGTTPNQPD